MVIVLARGKRSGIFENLTICHSVAHRMARTIASPAYRSHFHQLTQCYCLRKGIQLAQAAFSCFVPSIVRAALGQSRSLHLRSKSSWCLRASKSWGSGWTRTAPDRGLQDPLSRRTGSAWNTATDSCVRRSSLPAVLRRRDARHCDVQQGARDTS